MLLPLACIFKNDSGTWKVNNNGEITWEEWNDTDADTDDYSIALTDGGGGQYVADFPATIITAGRYKVVIYQGATPSTAKILGSGEIVWGGSAEITVDKILANKAIQNKSTGAIVYYDDDGVTPILTHTPTDGESTITRTPS